MNSDNQENGVFYEDMEDEYLMDETDEMDETTEDEILKSQLNDTTDSKLNSTF